MVVYEYIHKRLEEDAHIDCREGTESPDLGPYMDPLAERNDDLVSVLGCAGADENRRNCADEVSLEGNPIVVQVGLVSVGSRDRASVQAKRVLSPIAMPSTSSSPSWTV